MAALPYSKGTCAITSIVFDSTTNEYVFYSKDTEVGRIPKANGDAWGVTGEDLNSDIQRNGSVRVGNNVIVDNMLGIDIQNPKAVIDASQGLRTGIHNNAGASYYLTGNHGKIDNGVEFVHTNGTAGIGIGWGGIYATGSNNNNSFAIRAQTGSFIDLEPDAGYTGYRANNRAFFPLQDNGKSLGLNTRRWSVVYATNGTIQTSDSRLKENVKELHFGIEDVMKLNPVKYDWKDNGDKDKLGFIAQELIEVIPNVVVGSEDTQYGVNYAELIPVLTKAIQDQQNQIEDLRNQIKKLKNSSNVF